MKYKHNVVAWKIYCMTEAAAWDVYIQNKSLEAAVRYKAAQCNAAELYWRVVYDNRN